MLQNNEMINVKFPGEQMNRLKEGIQMKNKNPDRRYSFIIQHVNARPHLTDITKHTIKQPGLEVLSLPPYSPDLALSNYHVFWLHSNNLRGVSFNNDVELKTQLDDISYKLRFINVANKSL